MAALCTIATALCGAFNTIGGTLSGIVPSNAPTVDLGYQVQQPTLLNTQYDVYVFYDVRYAASPSGDNRFRAPQAPLTNRSAIQKGGEQRVCAQAVPAWQYTTNQWVPKYAAGQTSFKPSDFSAGPGPATAPDSRTTEDCLFLDVYVPRTVLNNAGKASGVPVIVQFYGGGYISGAKDLNPAGFYVRDKEQGGNGVIFVSPNYRLGAFGFLAGTSFQRDGDANAGLLDQRFALDWVRQNIAKFGGDPNMVTVIGESAGAGSIMHHITAYGGRSSAGSFFQKAIIQSPAFQPQENDDARNQAFSAFLNLLDVSDLASARKLDFSTVFKANAQQVYNSPYGQFTFGPAVDGSYVPDLPGTLLLKGRFNKNVAVMVGHNADEGIGFTSPYASNDSAFLQDVGSWMTLSSATSSNLAYINSTLYAPIFDGSRGYANQIARTDTAISELVFTCNTFYLDKAYNNQTYSYYFAVPPAYHGSDVGFTYYTGSTTNDPSVQVAVNMQRYFLRFMRNGNPNGADVPTWNTFGSSANMKVFNTTGNLRQMPDNTANARCNWWQANLKPESVQQSNDDNSARAQNTTSSSAPSHGPGSLVCMLSSILLSYLLMNGA
ncbi:hypothetical protein AC579_1433 [Pseudocercospora musae]|uniref:Carboxylic ester hydrolase n=1 Tax=Pseudocercospora musae TaxID=113226 RepID=A0A139IME3_9PEZI|nr:hypothetical protein AC579_1433 [Pseudocercospora musae]